MLRTQLRSFHAVALHGGFTAAAKILRIGQPTLTTQVKALERRYDVELLHRTKRSVRLTEAGRELFGLTTKITRLESESEDLLESFNGLRTGTLRIAAVGPFHATDMIVAFKSTYPLMDVTVDLGNSQQSFERLIEFNADVGIIAEIPRDERVTLVPYKSHKVVLLVSPEHPFFERESVAIRELQSQEFVLREKGSTTRTALEKALLQNDIEISPVLEIGSREGVWKAVEQGLGIGAVADFEFVPHPRLRILPFDDATIVTQYYLAHLKERAESRKIRAFVETALENAQSLSDGSLPSSIR